MLTLSRFPRAGYHRPGILLLLAVAVAYPGRVYACTKWGFTGVQSPNLAHMIARANADTLQAGPGAVEHAKAPGHFGPAVERTIYGQVVAVERLGGLAAAKLDRRTTRVVLVPWDYGADCTPTPWARSARWVQPGERGFFVAELRNRKDWVGGLPTFDVHDPGTQPFPGRGARKVTGQAMHPDSVLSIEQMFTLAEVLPVAERFRRTPMEALASLLAWAQANPDLARRYPANEILSQNLYAAEGARIRSIVPPVAGTYRFEAVLADSVGRTDSPRVFYARTRAHADHGYNPAPEREASDQPRDPLHVRRAPGYYILATGALRPDSLPIDLSRRRIEREGWMAMLAQPEVTDGKREEWRGEVEVGLLAAHFPADSAVQRFRRAAGEESYQRYREGFPRRADALFVRTPDGRVHVEQVLRLDDGRTLILRGERISQDVVQEPAWMRP